MIFIPFFIRRGIVSGCIIFWESVLILTGTAGCHFANSREKEQYISIVPDYHSTSMQVTSDTLRIPLDSDILPKSFSFNYRELKGKRYISFADQISHTIIIYDFDTLTQYWKIHVPAIDPDGNKIVKTEAWFLNFDSIFVSSYFKLYRMDSTGKILTTIDLSNKQPVFASTSLQNPTPAIFLNQDLCLPAYPYLYYSKPDDLKRWPVLCNIHLRTGEYDLLFHLPRLYHTNLYGLIFLQSFYCYNDQRKFVFSFPVDPDIYVYSPADSGYAYSYSGKSQFLQNPVEPVPARELQSGEEIYKSFLVRPSYGPIYYDSFHKRYLRVAEKPISRKQLNTKQWNKEHSLIIFDEHFKIIGESIIDKNINLNTLFITKEGIFVRMDAFKKDENNLYFVRLEYMEKKP